MIYHDITHRIPPDRIVAAPAWLDALDNLNPDEMTPRQALEALYRLKGLRAGE